MNDRRRSEYEDRMESEERAAARGGELPVEDLPEVPWHPPVEPPPPDEAARRMAPGANPWQGRLLAGDDHQLLKKGLRASSAYRGLRILAVCLTVIAAITLAIALARLVSMVADLDNAGGMRAVLEALVSLLVSPLVLLALAAVLRWLADFGDIKLEELADRLKDRQ